jgi:hypothetical protein
MDIETVKHQIIRRQLAVNNWDFKSFLVMVKNILLQYGPPTAYEVFNAPPTKEQWKGTDKKKLFEPTFSQLRREASGKITLRYLNTDAYIPGSLQLVWSTVKESPQDIIGACTNIRFLTGQFNQREVAGRHSATPI